jgi:hypothetical protein
MSAVITAVYLVRLYRRLDSKEVRLRGYIDQLYGYHGDTSKELVRIRESDHHQVLSDRQVLLDQTMARTVRVLMQFCDNVVETLPTHKRMQRHALSMKKKLVCVVGNRVRKGSGELFLSPNEWKEEARVEERMIDDAVARLQE